MSQYAVEIDPSNLNTSHAQVLDLVGRDRRVLDVGCWTGDLGMALAERGCRVSGFEINPEAAAIAAQRLDDVLVGNLDRERLSDRYDAGSFDVIIFADVLEHLMDPATVLHDSATLLAPGGRIVISIPNVTHGSVRLALLQGRWRTTDTGLLDHTHIRFFSREGLLRLVADAGLVIEDLRGTLADPMVVEVDVDDSQLPLGVVEWVRDQPDALVYQFQLACRPRREAEPETVVPDLTPGADPHAVRLVDADSRNVAFEWRRKLVARDHTVGLAAAADVTRANARRSRARIAELEAALARSEKAASEPQRSAGGLRTLARRIRDRIRR